MSTHLKSTGLVAAKFTLIFFFYCSALHAQVIVTEKTEVQQIAEESTEEFADESPDVGLIKRQKLIDKNLRKGFSLANKQENSRAIAKYEKVLELDPANSNAYYNLALLYAKSDQTSRAIEIIDKAFAVIDGNDENIDASDLYVLKANCLSYVERYKDALPFYEKSLSFDPNNANAHYNLGYTYFQLSQWQDAISHFDQYIKIADGDEAENEDYVAALSYTGQAYFQLAQYQKAIEHYDLAIEKKPEYRYFIRKAEALGKMGRKKEALLSFNQALKEHPNTAAIYHQRYQFYRDDNRLEEAYADLKKAYALEPENADYIFDMGSMYQKNNQMEQAIKLYEKCIVLNKNVDLAYGNIASIYSKSELTRSKAFEFYKKAIAKAPNVAAHYYNLANAYREANEMDLAIAMYSKAVELDPMLSMALNNMAIIYSDKKDFKKAIALMHEAIKLDPNDYIYNAQLASLYFETNQYKNTIEFTTKALQIERHGSFTSKLLNQRAISRQMLGEYKNAIYDYLDIIGSFTEKEKKENAGLISNMAFCYMEANELNNALKYFKEAVEYEAQVDHLIGLFSVQYLLGNQKEFTETLARAKQAEPKLAQGYKGIELMETDGYFYTKTHKKILKEIFKQNP
jgi:tetratricopeptide (TPR) repeat protein